MANKRSNIERLENLLDPTTWPVKSGNMFLMDGEVWCFESEDPLEERIYRPLFRESDKLIICR